MNPQTKTRESGTELLRIVLMLLIVIHHLIVHGSYLINIRTLPDSFGTYQKLIIESFLLYPMACFVFISGFYGINLKLKKLISFWLQCLFYSISIIIILKLFLGYNFNFLSYIQTFIPISTSIWWFVTVYWFLMLLSPVLNFISKNINQSMFKYVLLVGILINLIVSFLFKFGNIGGEDDKLGGNGSTLVNFIFIYMLASYFKKYQSQIIIPKKYFLLIVFLLCSTIIALLSIMLFKYMDGEWIWTLYSFNNPLILISAICIFYLFNGIKIKSKLINSIGALVFAVYLIHEHPFVRNYIYSNIFPINHYAESGFYIIYLILFATTILVTGLMIEKIRMIIMSPVLNYIYRTKLFNSLDLKMKRVTVDYRRQ